MSKATEHRDRAAEYHDHLASAWHGQEAVNCNASRALENANYLPDYAHDHTLHILKESAMDFFVMLVSLTAIGGLVLIDLWVLAELWHLVFR